MHAHGLTSDHACSSDSNDAKTVDLGLADDTIAICARLYQGITLAMASGCRNVSRSIHAHGVKDGLEGGRRMELDVVWIVMCQFLDELAWTHNEAAYCVT